MMSVEQVLSRLANTRRNSTGWMARCPAHDDRRASLSISIGDDDRVLLHCHAGCTPEDVVGAMGLKLADLMPGNGTASRPSAKAAKTAQQAKCNPKVCPKPQDAIAQLERKRGPHSAAWTYHDADGEPVGMIVRWDTDGGKDIRPLAKTAKGWIIGGMPEPRPLYRLPELLAQPHDRVYVVEGEKAADAGASIGLLATTSPQGSKNAAAADWSPLAGRQVVILPDNDDAGRRYAKQVAGTLATLEPPPTVRIVDLPELPQKGDIYDWLEERDSIEPNALRGIVECLADDALPLDHGEIVGGPVLTCLADVKPTAVKWLWFRRVPLGRITLLVGMPGEGKSFLTTYMAARVSTASPWPDGSDCPRGSVIFITSEDDPADTIRPRLDAHYADVRRVHLLAMVRKPGNNGEQKEVMFTLADVDELETALKTHHDCKLVIVDPIGSFLGAGIDAHRDNGVRGVLAPVAMLAERYGAAVVVVMHRRKSGSTFADDLAMGSRGFTGIARAVWHLMRDQENKGRRLLLPGKNNLAPEGGGLAFTIAGDPPAISWDRDPVAMTADEALAADNGNEKQKPGPEPNARDRAVEWLRDLLKDGPMASATILQEGKEAGYSSRTLYRAKDELGIKPCREGFEGGRWTWKLPPTAEDKDATRHDP